ncbi:MAG TPA: HTH domain-containing protein [Lacipirellulaceae bacterium]|nr:HTH domain-containing protein [Lacipirellulaceae bacterium]
MDHFTELRQRAREKRDATIRRARLDYLETIRRLRAAMRALNSSRTISPPERRKIKSPAGTPYCDLTTIQAAVLVLQEGKPMTTTELTIEIQGRGCRSDEPSRQVAKALLASLRYHRRRFSRGEDGRWHLAP